MAIRLLIPAMLVFALAAAGQRGPGRGGPGGRPGPLGRPGAGRPLGPPINAIDQWNSMSPKQRERALQKLPPERQKRIREQIDRFNSLPPEERERLRARYQRFSALPPETQDNMRREMRKFRDLPPERRSALGREMRRLREMPEADRQARVDSEEFRSRYSPEEREMLQDLSENLPPPPE
jgi:hypothetical protein